MTINVIALNRHKHKGRYADIIDRCEELAGVHGSATNALATMVRESPKFSIGSSKSKPRRKAVTTK